MKAFLVLLFFVLAFSGHARTFNCDVHLYDGDFFQLTLHQLSPGSGWQMEAWTEGLHGPCDAVRSEFDCRAGNGDILQFDIRWGDFLWQTLISEIKPGEIYCWLRRS